MQGKRHKVKISKTAGLVLALLLLLAGAAVTLSQALHGPLPTWDEIYVMAGLQPRLVPQPACEGETKIHSIDVGQSTATLLEQDGHFALVDAGDVGADETLTAYLRAAGVRKLDYIILTHPHADHAGAMQTMLAEFTPKTVILPDLSLCGQMPTTRVMLSLLEALDDGDYTVQAAQAGQRYALGDGEIEILFAGIETEDFYNNISVLCKFTVQGHSCLITGDAERAELNAAKKAGVDFTADILVAGHHGAENANPEWFVKAAAPQAVTVSCGSGNTYGHPHKEALQAFAAAEAEVYRTDEQGSILAVLSPQGEWEFSVTGKAA